MIYSVVGVKSNKAIVSENSYACFYDLSKTFRSVYSGDVKSSPFLDEDCKVTIFSGLSKKPFDSAQIKFYEEIKSWGFEFELESNSASFILKTGEHLALAVVWLSLIRYSLEHHSFMLKFFQELKNTKLHSWYVFQLCHEKYDVGNINHAFWCASAFTRKSSSYSVSKLGLTPLVTLRSRIKDGFKYLGEKRCRIDSILAENPESSFNFYFNLNKTMEENFIKLKIDNLDYVV